MENTSWLLEKRLRNELKLELTPDLRFAITKFNHAINKAFADYCDVRNPKSSESLNFTPGETPSIIKQYLAH
jgi:hypothetical protein